MDGSDPKAPATRLVCPQPICSVTGGDTSSAMMARLEPGVVFMMGDNPALPKMPEKPRLLDFFRLRLNDLNRTHLLQSAKHALDAGLDEKVVLACLLHDISNGCLIRTDHGYWGAQMIAPYVDEEVAWAVQHHQALRFFPDESVGYDYPDSYIKFFGPDYKPPEYIQKAWNEARAHRWYISARMITVYDVYSFEKGVEIEPELFTDIIGRHFREPEEGLGFDNSSSAHMWRTMIWPTNFL